MALARWARHAPLLSEQHFGSRRCAILAAYKHKALVEKFSPDACQNECLTRLDVLRSALLKGETDPRGLYMYGGVGTGKTMMLDLFHQELTAAGISCERQHFHAFMQNMNHRLHKLRGRVGAQQGLLARCAQEYKDEFSVLAFDEAHVLNVGDALMLRTFFLGFFHAGGVVVATSNVAPDDLYASGINREVFLPFLDTLRDRCDFFLMKGRQDYRSKAVEAGRLRGAYFAQEKGFPTGGSSPDQFPVLRDALGLPDSGFGSSENIDIDVGFGRTLRCDKAWPIIHKTEVSSRAVSSSGVAPQVVHFGFDELCRTATGPSEWVGIANAAEAIILTDVPRFEAHDEDAARRFVTFVDIVYDRQRFLVITAETSPEKIFSEIVKKYSGDDWDTVISKAIPTSRSQLRAPAADPQMKMPSHGLGSGRHGVVFQKPKQLHYGSSGAYVAGPVSDNEHDAPVSKATSVSRTGGRAEHGLGDPGRVMGGVVEEDSDWVEWSATGLKDASLFDLSPVNTDTQVTDKLLPFRRCASRLHQMQPRL